VYDDRNLVVVTHPPVVTYRQIRNDLATRADPDARVVVAGDFDSIPDEVPVVAIRATSRTPAIRTCSAE